MDIHQILIALYEIQGAADPNHPDDSLKERMREVWEKACEVMERTGFQPED